MSDTNGPRPDGGAPGQPPSHSQQREAGADERERLADERERLADEREALADDRDWLADRHDHELTRRETSSSSSSEEEEEEEDEARSALLRAEAAVRRAEAELARARLTSARFAARADRNTAARERSESVRHLEHATEDEDRAWLSERHEFVASARATIAADRDTMADERDERAGTREHLADRRERETLTRERDIERVQQAGRPMSAAQLAAAEQWQQHADMRARDERRRDGAATTRRVAAQERADAVADWGPTAYGPMLLGSFAKLASELFGSEELVDVLPQVLKSTVEMVAGCDRASITQWRHERVVDTAATDPVAAELDEVQFGSGLGPGPEALRNRDPIYVPRLAEPGRWPVLAAAAEQYEVASAVSHGLFVRQPGQWSALGVFTLYSQAPDAFSADDLEFASVLAAFVAGSIDLSRRSLDVDRREAALHRALSTRDVIGQAKGILMERRRLSAGEAFDLLRRASQRMNRKVTEVAQHLAQTGELPD